MSLGRTSTPVCAASGRVTALYRVCGQKLISAVIKKKKRCSGHCAAARLRGDGQFDGRARIVSGSETWLIDPLKPPSLRPRRLPLAARPPLSPASRRSPVLTRKPALMASPAHAFGPTVVRTPAGRRGGTFALTDGGWGWCFRFTTAHGVCDVRTANRVRKNGVEFRSRPTTVLTDTLCWHPPPPPQKDRRCGRIRTAVPNYF